jgi:hypothetical protein
VRSLILCLLLMLVRATTLPAQYEDGLVRLALPAGFEGPEVEAPSPGFKIVDFVRPIPGTDRGTLLQVTTIDIDVEGLCLPDSGEGHPTESVLAQFVAGVERRRERFEVVSRDRIELSGFPAARAEWRGTASGAEMHGLMYCVIVGSRVVILATQAFSDAPEDHLPAAVQAIESVILQP